MSHVLGLKSGVKRTEGLLNYFYHHLKDKNADEDSADDAERNNREKFMDFIESFNLALSNFEVIIKFFMTDFE